MKRNILNKAVEWIKRYLPAEIFAIVGAMIGGLVTNFIFNNSVITALGGTWGENLGYYGKILYSDVKKRKEKDEKITITGLLKVLRNTTIEFGPGEYLDSFIIRPFAMYFFPKIAGNVFFGLLLGKIAADVVFYIPTIFAFEFRKKYLND